MLLFLAVVCTAAGGETTLVADLRAALEPVLKEKAARWSHSGMTLAFRHQNETLQLAAGLNGASSPSF